MPRPPKKDEKKVDYLAYCIPWLIKNEGLSQEQASGYCYSMWNKGRLFHRIDHQFYGLLVDLGVLVQRTTEFLDQEQLVADFMVKWEKLVSEIEDDVMDQFDRGRKYPEIM